MEKSSGLSIASLVTALVAGPDVLGSQVADSAAWAVEEELSAAFTDSDNLGQNDALEGNSFGIRDVV